MTADPFSYLTSWPLPDKTHSASVIIIPATPITIIIKNNYNRTSTMVVVTTTTTISPP